MCCISRVGRFLVGGVSPAALFFAFSRLLSAFGRRRVGFGARLGHGTNPAVLGGRIRAAVCFVGIRRLVVLDALPADFVEFLAADESRYNGLAYHFDFVGLAVVRSE